MGAGAVFDVVRTAIKGAPKSGLAADATPITKKFEDYEDFGDFGDYGDAFIPDSGIATTAGQRTVEDLTNTDTGFGFRDVHHEVTDASAMAYRDAFDEIYNVLPWKKGTPKTALSLDGRLSLHPFNPGEQGTSDMTKGIFNNSKNFDSPIIGVKQPTDVLDEIQVRSTIHHEWFHALDEYMARYYGGHSGANDADRVYYASEGAKMTGMRKELFEKWDRLRQAVTTASPERRNMAFILDNDTMSEKQRQYFRDPQEMMARSFQQYMEVRLAESAGEPPHWMGKNYPGPGEMAVLRPLFDDLFAEFKSAPSKSVLGDKSTRLYSSGGGVGIIESLQQHKQQLDEAAGLTPPTQQEAQPVKTGPTELTDLSSEEQSAYIMSDYDTVAEWYSATHKN